MNTKDKDLNRASAAERLPKAWNGEECKAAFHHAASTKPWTLSYASAQRGRIACRAIARGGANPRWLAWNVLSKRSGEA